MFSPALPEPFLRACGLHRVCTRLKKTKQQSRSIMFRVVLCVQFYRLMQLFFSTSLKGIIRKECQSFTNHGHNKTPPTVFNPLSLWLTLSRNMGVSHTLWPPSITRAILARLWFAQGLYKAPKIKTAEPLLRDCGLHRASRQIKTASKGIIRKECQSFTNHGHDKTPLTVFNPLSLWLTLPRNMGVSHTLWPPSITRAILACPWFAQEPKIKTADPLLRVCGLHKAQKKLKTAEPFYDVQGYSMYSFLSVDATCFFNIT